MGNAAGFIITLVLLGGAFWLLIVRPRQRQLAAHSRLMHQLAEGDEIMTTSGIYGTVEAIEGDVVRIQIAPDVTIRDVRGAIARIVDSSGRAGDD